jgi:ABC-2 type transport system permease protein
MTTVAASSPPLIASHEVQSRAFHRLRWRSFCTRVAQGIATSRLRYALVVSLSVLLWYGLFYLVEQGFVFMKTTLPPGTHNLLVPGIFNSFFLALFLMLIFSSSVILYGSLFRGGEVAFLLTMPIEEERIFQHQFQYAVVLSSWGFILLGSPMLVAYGQVVDAPWYYYAMLLPMLAAFVYIPSGFGAILLLAIMHLIPRKRAQVLGLALFVVVALAVWFCWSLVARPETDLLTPRWFTEMLRRLQMTEARPLPNWWLSTGLLETAGGNWSEGVLFLGLLIANALFFRELAGISAERVYRRAYWAAAGMGSRPTRVQMGSFDSALDFCLRFLPTRVRLIVMKDVRLFRRDPLQWSQFLILVGLLLLYFINVHRVNSSQKFSQWVNVVSFMNLSVVGLLMSTFTTRFVFPMVSLEGRCFWLLGLLPLKRDTILWSKFLFSVGSLLVPCGLLVLLSDWRLDVPRALIVEHQVTSLLLCLGLSGIGVGLGARLPLLTEPSPSRIAAGFGGTLNLVVSTLFIVIVLVVMAMPYHILLAGEIDPAIKAGSGWLGIHRAVGSWLIVCTLISVTVSLVAALLPMWIGIRTFRRQEFH